MVNTQKLMMLSLSPQNRITVSIVIIEHLLKFQYYFKFSTCVTSLDDANPGTLDRMGIILD